eukprot:tig00000655_g2878.t1
MRRASVSLLLAVALVQAVSAATYTISTPRQGDVQWAGAGLYSVWTGPGVSFDTVQTATLTLRRNSSLYENRIYAVIGKDVPNTGFYSSPPLPLYIPRGNDYYVQASRSAASRRPWCSGLRELTPRGAARQVEAVTDDGTIAVGRSGAIRIDAPASATAGAMNPATAFSRFQDNLQCGNFTLPSYCKISDCISFPNTAVITCENFAANADPLRYFDMSLTSLRLSVDFTTQCEPPKVAISLTGAKKFFDRVFDELQNATTTVTRTEPFSLGDDTQFFPIREGRRSLGGSGETAVIFTRVALQLRALVFNAFLASADGEYGIPADFILNGAVQRPDQLPTCPTPTPSPTASATPSPTPAGALKPGDDDGKAGTPTPTPTPAPSGGDGQQLQGGSTAAAAASVPTVPIVAGVVGGVGGAALLAAVAFVAVRIRRRRSESPQEEGAAEETAQH